MTKRHKLSKRGVRRAAERDAVDLARDRVKLAGLVPGGSAERPLEVESASLVEVTAKSTRCAVCEGELVLDEHAAVDVGGVRLRRVDLTCRQCHVKRQLWFKLVPSGPN